MYRSFYKSFVSYLSFTLIFLCFFLCRPAVQSQDKTKQNLDEGEKGQPAIGMNWSHGHLPSSLVPFAHREHLKRLVTPVTFAHFEHLIQLVTPVTFTHRAHLSRLGTFGHFDHLSLIILAV